MEVIKSYKGFKKDMTCNPNGVPFQYEEGKEYETHRVEACSCGFHACERPLDVFKYYAPGTSIYHEVDQSGEIDRDSDDSKLASSHIKIGARLDIAGLVKAQIEYTKARTTTEFTDPEKATAGNRGAATAGNRGAATAGEYGAATAGYCGAATAGEYGAATAGEPWSRHRRVLWSSHQRRQISVWKEWSFCSPWKRCTCKRWDRGNPCHC